MPDGGFLVLCFIIVLGLTFDFINGFHDTANAIATSVATRVLPPVYAVSMATVLNVLGALTGTAVATTVGRGIVPPQEVTQQLVVAALFSAIAWNLITWWHGIPSSSSHALIFSIVGAGVASSGWDSVQAAGVGKVLQGLVFSPALGFIGSFAILSGLFWLFARAHPSLVTGIFGRLQIVSAAYMAFSHGSNDAQKTMGVMTMAIASYYGWAGDQWEVPTWVILAAATAMGCGTALGGWRIIRTMGFRVVALRPIDGFAAETAAATVIEVASRFGIPVSTTHVISAAILGAGSSKRLSAVKWGIAGQILAAWLITLPVCITMGWLFYSALHFVTRVS